MISGTVVFVGSMACSSSPRMGDSILTSTILSLDLEAEQNQTKMTHGLTRLLRGTDRFFVIIGKLAAAA